MSVDPIVFTIVTSEKPLATYWELHNRYTFSQMLDLYEMMEARATIADEAHKEAERNSGGGS